MYRLSIEKILDFYYFKSTDISRGKMTIKELEKIDLVINKKLYDKYIILLKVN